MMTGNNFSLAMPYASGKIKWECPLTRCENIGKYITNHFVNNYVTRQNNSLVNQCIMPLALKFGQLMEVVSTLRTVECYE